MNTEPTTTNDNQELSIRAKYLIRLCRNIIKDVKEGKCSEEEINDILVSSVQRQNGYINPDEYLNADKAMKFIGTHRNDFFALIRKHKVEPRKVNNQPIGYHLNDLKRIKNSISKDC